MPPMAFAGSVIGTGLLAWGALERNSPLFGRVQHRLATGGRTIALTFDDGPNPDATPAILDALGAAGVRATFFVLGRHAQRWPELVARTAAEGHVVANHGYRHRRLLWHGPRFVRDDIEAGARAIQTAGAPPPSMFRAPHGQRNPWVTPIARRRGQRTIGWTLGVWDTQRPGSRVIADRVIQGVTPDAIVLLHDGDGYDPHGDRMQTALAVPSIIETLATRGYSFAAVT